MLSATEQNAQERAAHWELMEGLRKEEPRLVFIDESSINTDLVRRHGWAPKGERLPGKVPRNTPPAHAVIGALAPEGLIAAMELEGSIDGIAFATFVESFLRPQLRRDDIVLLDNNSTHLHKEALACIEAAGAWTIFLPAYSPDFNPIEECWSKVKTLLRKARARTTRALHRAFARAVSQITPENAQAWFKHIGYWASPA